MLLPVPCIHPLPHAPQVIFPNQTRFAPSPVIFNDIVGSWRNDGGTSSVSCTNAAPVYLSVNDTRAVVSEFSTPGKQNVSGGKMVGSGKEKAQQSWEGVFFMNDKHIHGAWRHTTSRIRRYTYTERNQLFQRAGCSQGY